MVALGQRRDAGALASPAVNVYAGSQARGAPARVSNSGPLSDRSVGLDLIDYAPAPKVAEA
jgi:hypothetical protein